MARAQVDNIGILDDALKQFRATAQNWQTPFHSAATSLFWSLATISLVWTMAKLALRRADLGEFFSELMPYLLFTGFWAWMLENGPEHARLIIESMAQLGSAASGHKAVTSSGILDMGFHVFDRGLIQSAIASPLRIATGLLLALGVLVILAIVAANMLVTYVACWVVANAGLIVLGFGGSRWTNDMAVNYYRMVLSLGLQVMTMVLVVGMGEGFLRGYLNRLEADVSLHEFAVLLVVGIVLLMTVNRIPSLVGGLANGSSPQYAMGAGVGVSEATAAMKAAAAVLSSTAALGTGVVGGAVSTVAGGATAAIKAGMGALQNAQADFSGAMGSLGVQAMMSAPLDGVLDIDLDDDDSSGGSGSGSVFPAPGSSDSASSSGQAVSPGSSDSHGSSERSEGLATKPSRPNGSGASTDRRGQEASAGRTADANRGRADDDRRNAEAEVQAGHRSAQKPGQAAHGQPSSSQESRASRNAGGQNTPSELRQQKGGSLGQHDARSGASSSSREGASDASVKTSGSTQSATSTSTQTSGAAAAAASSGRQAASSASSVGPASAGTLTPASPSTVSAGRSRPTPDAFVPPGFGTLPMMSPPSGTFGAATLRSSARPDDLTFSTGQPSAEGRNESAPKARAPHSSRREENKRAPLPEAYKTQTAVDFEGEIAAFRDRE